MKFSLVITTYNRLELLKRAIACGLNQTVSCEVVVDDAIAQHPQAVLGSSQAIQVDEHGTELRRTPATGHLLLPGPGSAVAQHYPGSGRMVHFATGGPGSASAQRYPGSAVAAHRTLAWRTVTASHRLEHAVAHTHTPLSSSWPSLSPCKSCKQS